MPTFHENELNQWLLDLNSFVHVQSTKEEQFTFWRNAPNQCLKSVSAARLTSWALSSSSSRCRRNRSTRRLRPRLRGQTSYKLFRMCSATTRGRPVSSGRFQILLTTPKICRVSYTPKVNRHHNSEEGTSKWNSPPQTKAASTKTSQAALSGRHATEASRTSEVQGFEQFDFNLC